jgi:hypothetical protein
VKTQTYRQCSLVKVGGTSTLNQVSYIPSRFAIVGKVLKLEDDCGKWTDGWKVVGAGPEMSAEDIEKWSRDYLKNRKASDIERVPHELGNI